MTTPLAPDARCFREALLRWIRQQGRPESSAELDAATPILERRVVTSLQLPDLILFIERLVGRRVVPGDMAPGVFHSVDSIARHFGKERG